MKPLLVLLLLVGPAFAAAEPAEASAKSLAVVRPTFTEPEVVLLKTLPPGFELVLVRNMPSPGWQFEIDALEVNTDSGRIVARVTEVRPEGMVAQVISPTRLKLPLGKLAAGYYVLELWTRRGTDREHVPAHAMILHAR